MNKEQLIHKPINEIGKLVNAMMQGECDYDFCMQEIKRCKKQTIDMYIAMLEFEFINSDEYDDIKEEFLRLYNNLDDRALSIYQSESHKF